MRHDRAVTDPYDGDFFAWTQRQAKLLRTLRHRADLPPGLDLEQVAE